MMISCTQCSLHICKLKKLKNVVVARKTLAFTHWYFSIKSVFLVFKNANLAFITSARYQLYSVKEENNLFKALHIFRNYS